MNLLTVYSSNHEIQEKKSMNDPMNLNLCKELGIVHSFFLSSLYSFTLAFTDAHFNSFLQNVFSPIFIHWPQSLSNILTHQVGKRKMRQRKSAVLIYFPFSMCQHPAGIENNIVPIQIISLSCPPNSQLVNKQWLQFSKIYLFYEILCVGSYANGINWIWYSTAYNTCPSINFCPCQKLIIYLVNIYYVPTLLHTGGVAVTKQHTGPTCVDLQVSKESRELYSWKHNLTKWVLKWYETCDGSTECKKNPVQEEEILTYNTRRKKKRGQ